jgi:hypothetical protein
MSYAPEKMRERYLKVLARYLVNPCVLIAKEKHGTVYMDALTAEGLYASCLALLKFRRKEEYYYTPELPKKPSLTAEQAFTLPEGPVRNAANAEFNRYKRAMDDYHQQLEFVTGVDEAIKNEDGLLAYILLKERGDAEYEEIDLEPITRTYG